MSFPAYPKYKDSGVEWLGQVPEHWENWKIAHAFPSIGSGTTPKSDNAEYYDNGTIPWVNTGDLNDSTLTQCARLVTEKAVAEHSSLKMYPSGSLLFAMYGATIGRLGILEFDATVNQACCVFSGASPLGIKFLFYWFLGLRQQILSLATGGGQPNVSQDILRVLRVSAPPLPEQHAIASFLDRETSKIDALVAEQRKLIELLKEKRQAVISHTVTKGLNPDAPMKDSGIEWLGMVPEHWEVVTLKRVATVNTGVAKGKDHSGQATVNVPYLRVANVQDGYVNLDEITTIDILPHELDRYRLWHGDVLMNEGGDYDKLGRGCVWESQIDPCITQNHVFAVRPHSVDPWWLNKITSSEYAQFYFMSHSKQSTNLASISSTNLMNLPVVLPPRQEQAEVLSFVNGMTSKFESLVLEGERAIDLLQERRTALISAAVTGKIDVRSQHEATASTGKIRAGAQSR